jgi:hypothetical protein
MAKRGTRKAYSIEQEEAIARAYGGERSPSSGAADTDGGDVRCRSLDTLFECKYSGSPGEPLKSKPKILTQMEGIADEAYAESRDPALALRYYCPNSPLADHKGWVDLVVRRLGDDVRRRGGPQVG